MIGLYRSAQSGNIELFKMDIKTTLKKQLDKIKCLDFMHQQSQLLS